MKILKHQSIARYFIFLLEFTSILTPLCFGQFWPQITFSKINFKTFFGVCTLFWYINMWTIRQVIGAQIHQNNLRKELTLVLILLTLGIINQPEIWFLIFPE